MDDDALQSLESAIARRAGRPLGDTEKVTGRTLQPFSFAGQEAAENLLTKARRALATGDPDRARKHIDRAARLPFDDHEQAAPAAFMVHQELFEEIIDALEVSEPGDRRWLDAALEVLETADEPARHDLRDVLAAIDQDYRLEPAEQARLRSAIAPVPERAELIDLDLDEAELSEHVQSILIACTAYRAALESHSDRPRAGCGSSVPSSISGADGATIRATQVPS